MTDVLLVIPLCFSI